MRSVAAIFTAPVKSLSLEQPASVTVGQSGIAEDRRFFMIDAEGRLLTQRQEGRLATVKARYSADSEVLVLNFPNGDSVEAPTELGDALITVMWGRQVPGREVTGPYGKALSAFCGSPVRLVKTDNPGECYDEYPVSLLSQASLDFLSQQPTAGRTFEGRRFRPNFLIDGCSPNEEDSWLGGIVQIGPELRLRLVAQDPRCAITTLDPDTGQRDFDVPRLLLSYRPGARAPYFGIYGEVETTGRVSLGDAVELVQDPPRS